MYPPHHLGGYELCCRDVVERWRDRGHEVTVLTTTMRVEGVPDLVPDDRSVRRELDFYYRDHLIWRPPFRRRLQIERSNHAALERALTEIRPDVVSLWHMGAMSMSLISTLVERKVPAVFVLGDAWLVYGPVVDAWLGFFSRRPRLARLARTVTGVPTRLGDTSGEAFCFASDWLRERALLESPYSIEHAAVVHHGIDERLFSANGEVRQWSWRLLCVGRLDERKGIHVAIEALTHLPEATLEVLGRGDDRYLAKLRARAGSLGVGERVRFGSVSREELRDRYVGADVFLFPILWDEPFGLVPLEAMACGTPVVSTATGGSAEFLIDGANCLVVDRDDARALAAAVVRLAEDTTLRERIVVGGTITAGVFTTEKLASHLEAWHLAVAGRSSGDVLPDTSSSALVELRDRVVRDP